MSVGNFVEGPAVVDVNLMFRSFPTISDNKMVIEIDIFKFQHFSFSSKILAVKELVAWHVQSTGIVDYGR